MLINLKNLSPVLVMISSMSGPICNQVHDTHDNSGKITTFYGGSCLTPACAGLLEPRGSGLRQLKSTLSAENFVCRLSWSIASHFGAIQCWNVRSIQKLRKKYTKNPFMGVQGRSKSSMLINLKSLSPVLVMISSMSVPICSRVHATRDNCGKITTF